MKIAIIGCGSMGSSFAARLSLNHQLRLFDRNKSKVEKLAKEVKGESYLQIDEAVKSADVVILAIKPKDLAALGESLTLESDQIVISMLSGTTIAAIKEVMGEEYPVVRVMPNTPVSLGQGVTGVAYDDVIEQKNRGDIDKLLSELGLTIELSEKMIDSLTPLSGCGPAFVFLIMEAFIEAGVALGFKASDAQNLAVQTFEGSLQLLKESAKLPTALKLQVAAPGGDTIKGLIKMERKGLKAALIDGILAAKP